MGTNKENILNLYNLEETPDAVYEAMMRLEGNYKSRGRSLPGDEELVQNHIKTKCEEIRAIKDVLKLHRTDSSSPGRVNEARVEKDLASEVALRDLLRTGFKEF
ncbi:uncharacterized protein METZ01_LOCUS118829 [marine metagenome]|uniref:Uncharacterized protein n=1 Tax=marine metagenome TaxID=408172 RepID=A0A381XMI6_9ZZZZ